MEIKNVKWQSTDNIVIAFDQATYTTGFSVWNADTKELKTSGVIKVSGADTIERINKIKKDIAPTLYKIKAEVNSVKIILEDIQYQPEKEACAWGNAHGDNIKTFKTLAWLQGVLLSWFKENFFDVSMIFAATWKSFCQIKGQQRAVQKQNAILFVKNNFNIDVSSDEADAICLGWTAINK